MNKKCKWDEINDSKYKWDEKWMDIKLFRNELDESNANGCTYMQS